MRVAAASAALELALLIIFLRDAALAIQVPKTEEKKEESTRKDLKVASTSYAYSKTGDALSPYEYIDSARYRSSVHGLNSGLNYPFLFHLPSKYRFGGSLHGGGLGRKSFDLGSDEIDGSLARNGHKFHLDLPSEADDLLEHDGHLGHGHDHHHHHHHHHHEHDEDHHHHEKEHEKGEKSSEEHESSAKEEGSKGYKVKEKFDKGEKKEKEKSKESGHAEEEAGSKVAHEDEQRRHKEREEAAHAEKGEHFSQSEGHKKGHRTSGYHNVYRKDEYKKDTEFYDDEHVDSQQEQYRKEEEKRSEAEGEREKKASLDAAYEQAEKSREGFFTNAHQYGRAQGHEREEALKEHHEKEHESHQQKSGSGRAASESESSHSHR